LNDPFLAQTTPRKPTLASWVAGVLGAVLLVCGGYFGLLGWAERPGDLQAPIRYEIHSGQSFGEIAEQLLQRQVVANTALFSLYARLHGLDGVLQAGEYEIPRRISPQSLLTLMSTGKVVQHSVQLAEGFRLQDVLAELRNDAILIDDLGIGFSNNELQRLLVRLNLDLPFAEGYFFPDTYYVVKGTKVSDVLLLAQQAMSEKLDYAWRQKNALAELATPEELLILASIIEKESAEESDRRTISQVFHNRLRLNMRLQTDPTVIYALGDSFDGDIRSRDLRVDSPFNTYRVRGLPPTPIALPSLNSLLAAAQPTDGDYIYFVARGDGTSQFSRTLEEHNSAVRRFQLKRAE
jgi:UPF0755 protein